jgi:hypothetical protein
MVDAKLLPDAGRAEHDALAGPTRRVIAHPASKGQGHTFEIAYLAPNQLITDPRYQRETSYSRVEQYADAWDYDLAQALTVNVREDGSAVIVDGQHRWRAAIQSHQEALLCYVYYGLTPTQEADLFHKLSTRRAALTARDRFRARLFAGDPLTHAIVEICAAHGYQIDLRVKTSKDPDTLGCVTALENIYRSGLVPPTERIVGTLIPSAEGEQALHRLLRIVRATWPDDRDAKNINLLWGVHLFMQYYQRYVSEEEVIAKWRATNANTIVTRAWSLSESSGGSRLLWSARVLLDLWNKSKRTNRLPDLMPRLRVNDPVARAAEEG